VTVARLYAGFYRPNESLRPVHDAWLAAYPRSPQALLARAMYLRALGWKARGTKYWDDTPLEARAAMDPPFLQAVRDTRAALAIDARLMPGYFMLIDIAMVYGQRAVLDDVYREARRIDPGYYDVHDAYLIALSPKWGGSEAEIEQVLADLRRHYPRYPALRKLEAQPALARGYRQFQAKQYDPAIAELTRALEANPDLHAAREYRGLAYQNLGRHDEARDDYRRAADGGAAYAKYQLGWLYLYGRGVPRDHRQAARWLGEAAEAGVAEARAALGALYWEGSGVAQDRERAAQLWRTAAAQGDAYARESLARNGLAEK
jgi:tetratricopeptide (TPR) repeat protein